MTIDGKMKSAQLRDELERVRVAIEGCKEDEAAALAEIRSLARAAIAPDGDDALKRCRAAEGRLGQARMGAKRLHDARGEIELDLAQAIAEEDQAAREADAKAATAFAESLPNVFRECDRNFAQFHQSFSAAIATINTGRARGWNVPSQELFQSKLIRVLQTWLSVAELRMLNLPPLPPPERCSFASLGESYALAIRGGTKHAVLPPKPQPQPIASPAAAKSEDSRLPPRGDVGVRFRDDPKEFEIRIPAWR